MKKFKQLLVMLLVLSVCACKMKTQYKMEIKNDKSMDVSVLMAFDDELIDAMISSDNEDTTTGAPVTPEPSTNANNAEITDNDRWNMINEMLDSNDQLKNFKSEKYDQDGFKGMIYTTSVSNIDNISGDKPIDNLEDATDFNKVILFKKDGNKYQAKFKIDTDVDSGDTQSSGVDLSSIMDFTFVVTLPEKPISHNATSVSDDGKTLTWNLSANSNPEIQFEFAFPEKNNTMYIAIAAGVVVLLLIVIIIIFTSKKKNKNGDNQVINPMSNNNSINQPYPTSPVQPAAPQQPMYNSPMPQPPVSPTFPQQNVMENNPAVNNGVPPVTEVVPSVEPVIEQPASMQSSVQTSFDGQNVSPTVSTPDNNNQTSFDGQNVSPTVSTPDNNNQTLNN